MKCIKAGDLVRPKRPTRLTRDGMEMHGVVVEEAGAVPTLPRQLLVLWADSNGLVEYEDELVLIQEGKGNA